jgi:NADH-quinone oxidoreductase subunit G
MCDEGRFGFKYIHDKKRIASPILRRGMEETTPNWSDLPEILRFRFEKHVRDHGPNKVVAMLSPFMACEEAWLLIKFIRYVAPQSALAMGPVPMSGDDEKFPKGSTNGKVTFTVLKEKCPNRVGIEKLLALAGGATMAYEDFVKRSLAGEFSAAWMVGGYPQPWVDKDAAQFIEKFSLLVVQDIFPSELLPGAACVLPACAWTEREGSFVNAAGVWQSFDRATDPPDGAMRDGQYLYELAGYSGLYSGERVRELMKVTGAIPGEWYEPPEVPEHAH